MILDTSLQSIIANTCYEKNKSIEDLTTIDILDNIVIFLNTTKNYDYTFNKESPDLQVIDILLETFTISDKHCITITDFINTWHILSNMTLLSEMPSPFSKDRLSPVEQAVLKKYGEIMNDLAYSYDTVYGRDLVIQQMVTVLSRRKKSSVLLVGNPGCGKTAIVHGLVSKCINNGIPKLNEYTFVSIQGHILKNLAMIPSGAQELEAILRACRSKVILFIDEFHTICTDERSSSALVSVIDIIKPALANGMLQIIGATTHQEAKKYVYHDKALTRRIQEIKVEDMQEDDIIKVLHNIIPIYETYHHCRIKDKPNVIREIVKLSARYLSDKHEPDRSIDIIDETLATISGKVEKTSSLKNTEIAIYSYIKNGDNKQANKMLNNLFEYKKESTKTTDLNLQTFRTVIARKANVPADLLNRSDLDRIKIAEQFLNEKVIGQDHAVKTFVSAIRKFKTGLSNPNRPISILLVGPTGTGKTYICKETAHILFDGRKDSFLRFDMTEFSAPHSVSTLLGSPPGYVDSDKGGELTEHIYKNPYSMILFDEIEKANPLVINVLLQLLDEGQISDAMGKTINFRNCIIIMTSNAGMHNVIASKKTLGFDRLMHEPSKDIIHNDIVKGLKEYFQPEFINRIDATCIFNYLSKDEIIKILDLEIKSVLNRIKINVHVKQETKDKIIKNYYSEEYGARSIKRGVEDLVVDQLSQLIINNPNAESLEL